MYITGFAGRPEHKAKDAYIYTRNECPPKVGTTAKTGYGIYITLNISNGFVGDSFVQK